MQKTAVVTGAGKGIGRAIALAYAAQGMNVCCISRTLKDLEDTVNTIKSRNGHAIFYSCDVTDYMEMTKAFQYTYEAFGAIDIVVINAGIDCAKKSVEELEVEEWERVINVNLTGAFITAKVAIPYLKKNTSGKIITIGSGMGHKGRINGSAYNCSKAGLWMLTRTLAQELIEYNISVNELIPGPVNTEMGEKSIGDSHSASSINGEWNKSPEDVTQLALFLANQPSIGPTAQSFSLMRRDL